MQQNIMSKGVQMPGVQSIGRGAQQSLVDAVRLSV